jgi:uncharacterized MAPEG superfamily protein
MSSIASALGLSSSRNTGPYYAIFNFLFAHIILTPRTMKQIYGIDHNVNPREDLATYGERAVQEGKITRAKLDLIKRVQSAQANAIENYPVWLGSVLFATLAKVPNETINKVCVIYTAARLAHAVAYLTTTTVNYSYIRTVAWKVGLVSYVYLFWQSAKYLNAGIA